MSDLIDRQASIEAVLDRMDGEKHGRNAKPEEIQLTLEKLPSAQPERLTDDDFETIRIHLNAYKEKLCNQQRWEEADEYQRIIDRFMAFASAQQEIVRCVDCKYFKVEHGWNCASYPICEVSPQRIITPDDYCSFAERGTDG